MCGMHVAVVVSIQFEMREHSSPYYYCLQCACAFIYGIENYGHPRYAKKLRAQLKTSMSELQRFYQELDTEGP